MSTDISQKLDQLANFQAQRDVLEADAPRAGLPYEN